MFVYIGVAAARSVGTIGRTDPDMGGVGMGARVRPCAHKGQPGYLRFL